MSLRHATFAPVIRNFRAFATTSTKNLQRQSSGCTARTPQCLYAGQSERSTRATTSRLAPSCRYTRSFSAATARNANRTMQQVKARNRSGPFNWKAGLLFIITGAGLIIYFRYEKERMQRRRIAEQNKGIGKPLIGGKFELMDTDGKVFTEQDLKGKYSLIYFGFTHCPDICPDELDKMAKMIDIVKAKRGNVLNPVFISCDPWRDSPEVVHKYLQEFHPDIIGLTGKYDNVKNVCKTYRVYFSTPPGVKEGQDYIVDHSIYFYLMDPEGDFVEAIGRERTAEEGADAIVGFAKDWRGQVKTD